MAAATVLALTASCGGDGARRRTPPPVIESFSPTSVSRIGLTVLLSVALGTGSCALGLALSTHWNLAAGGTITLVVAVVFLISLALSPTAACSSCLCGAAAVPTG
ncbi:metal ABC transporter permease [Streptomyces sp. ADMS]|uniref:metal ABC transporter permease n=1 Tax=Streptomyces sp. ADMS TaxID=3071415 RepID=UPI00296EDB3A|nr:metal ABC transporter permease [Streptomyces sp. ADMS]MDW4909839.1 metal ABC transporter permease [Streptomyces sp. ADMS]